ncbi:MAG: Murein hydrolase activator NlpD precursor [Chloroflexi bacterium ADurb.Bin325]|nr:MAG: Murein hydrolase activator NlpD precursor [Chloroflexi bacterium ADurb.Bin325]
MRADLASDSRPTVPPNEWGPGYQFWQSVLNLLAQRGPEGTTSLVRVGSHLIILLVAVLVLVFSKVNLPAWDIAEEPVETAEIIDGALIPEYAADTTLVEENSVENGALTRAAVPITLIPERSRLDVVTYTVTAGDTLYGIAQRYKLNAETIMFSNGLEKNPDLLRLGQQLVILPLNGIYHTVSAKDTIQSIAKAYKVTPESIIQYPLNHLDAQNPVILPGQKLIVPGGVKELPKPDVTVYQAPAGTSRRGTGVLIWPTSGSITQGYKPLHRALDIARAMGTPIKAADAGVVVVAGWSNSGYGYHIVIDHGNGLQTLYAHLSRILVKRGTVVAKGGVIGNMGSTGRSTGPHLHFEVRKDGVQVNPVGYLP